MFYVSFMEKERIYSPSHENVYEVRDENDYLEAIESFRRTHKIEGTLLVLGSYDQINWKVLTELNT